MTSDSIARVRRALLVLCAIAATWALVVPLTGGFMFRVGAVRISSRNPLNGIIIALVAALAAGVLSVRDWRRAVREDRAWLRYTGTAVLESVRQRSARLRRVGVAQALAIVGAGLIVQQWAIARPLFLDEEMIALNVRDRSVAELMGPLWLAQSAPYGWLVLERAAVLAFGTSERAVRLLPALFGIATVAAAFVVGRRWMGPVGAAILILLCGIGQWLSHNALMLKPYSADAFWALLLPALGAWAVDRRAGDRPTPARRAAIWWAACAIGQWFANGALLVTPGCAVVLILITGRQRGWEAARRFGRFGVVWIASFALHYLVSIRHTLNSPYLQNYWSFAMPPASAGIGGTLVWLAAQLAPLADNPGGTSLWVTFWLFAAGGFATRFPLGLLFATVPVSACALAVLRIVPLYERLALWVLPAMYVGIALAGDEVARFGREAFARRRWIRLAAAIVVAVGALQLCADIFRRGRNDILRGRPPGANQQLDDRSGVGWLMRHARPGDALMTTHLALPALWWYGGISISDRHSSGSHRQGGGPVFELDYWAGAPECGRDQLSEALKDRQRVLIYFGFRYGMPDTFDDLLLQRLGELGVVSAYREFTEKGRAAVVDLKRPDTVGAPRRHPAPGCIVVQPARRW